MEYEESKLSDKDHYLQKKFLPIFQIKPIKLAYLSQSQIQNPENFAAEEKVNEIDNYLHNKRFRITLGFRYNWISDTFYNNSLKNPNFVGINIYDLNVTHFHSILELADFQHLISPNYIEINKVDLFIRNQSSITPFLLIFKKLSNYKQIIQLIPTLSKLYNEANLKDEDKYTRRCENYIHMLLNNRSLNLEEKIMVLSNLKQKFQDYMQMVTQKLNDYDYLPFITGVQILCKDSSDINLKLTFLSLLSPNENWLSFTQKKIGKDYELFLEYNKKLAIYGNIEENLENYEFYYEIFLNFNILPLRSLVINHQYEIALEYFNKSFLDFRGFFQTKELHNSDIFTLLIENNNKKSLKLLDIIFENLKEKILFFTPNKENEICYFKFLLEKLGNIFALKAFEIYDSSTIYHPGNFDFSLIEIECEEYVKTIIRLIFESSCESDFDRSHGIAENFLGKVIYRENFLVAIYHRFLAMAKEVVDKKKFNSFIINTLILKLNKASKFLTENLVYDYYTNAIKSLSSEEFKDLKERILIKNLNDVYPLFHVWKVIRSNESSHKFEFIEICHLLNNIIYKNLYWEAKDIILTYPGYFSDKFINLYQDPVYLDNINKFELENSSKIYKKILPDYEDEEEIDYLLIEETNPYETISNGNLDFIKLFLENNVLHEKIKNDSKFIY